MINEFYAIFGQIIIILLLLFIALLLFSLFLGRVAIKNDKFIFPKLVLFTTDLFYGPFKKLSENMGFDSTLVDHISVEVRNKVNSNKFKSIDNNDKIIVLPHCLRNPNCPATLERSGLECILCNKCVIGNIKEKAEELGYSVFIIPGSTFIKSIAERKKFKAVLGVACYQDLNLAMMNLGKFYPQGVPLSRDGCYRTKVDLKAVYEIMGVCDDN